ncbi:class I SAM-dependent methyltransferase [Roseibium sp. RKSG952]|uniref:class I SAM-dependent methyltransferase n=1 Tax=Roseibium sp. RKSG952 TaxID=2529384 RepID=UPI0018AD0ED0|nr:methyltransferase [Roseibium sp. RKSG952]
MVPRREMQSDGRQRTAREFVRDEWVFFRHWVEHPFQIGAISPSGPRLAEKMVAQINMSQCGRVIEIGAGTGAVTARIIAQGVPNEALTVIEYSPDFCRLLSQKFSGVGVVNGDGYALRQTLRESNYFRGASENESVDAILSCLPLLTRPEKDRLRLLEDAVYLLKDGAPFVQFSYGLRPPVSSGALPLEVSGSGWVLNNLPPARVWVYRKKRFGFK